VATVRSSSAGPLSSDRIDVLIVGAGPVGLALALQAHAHGAQVKVVERRGTVFRPSRAMILHPRTLESLRPLGVTDALVARAMRSPRIRIHLASREHGGSREHTVQLDAFGLANTPFPEPLLVRQSDLEAVLASALTQRGVVVERGIELESFAQHPHLVTARTCSRDGAAEVSSRYLAGCDGASSTVRTLSRIGWSGGEYRSEVALADVELAGPVSPDTVHVVVAASGLVFLFPLGEHATWRLLATRRAAPSEVIHGAFGPPAPATELQELLSATGWAVRIAQVAWSSRIRPPHRVADRFREGRVFLVGDAAHAHSPAGGQGMNTGIHDAVNLGWKLAYASRVGDAAAEELLRSYEQERRPVARQILGLTRLLFWAEAGIGRLPRLLRSRLTPLAVRGLRWLPQRASLGRLALYLLAQFWVRYRRSTLSTELRPRSRQLRAGNRLPNYLVDCNGRRVRLHDLTATPGVHVLLARDAEALDSAASPWLHVHRLDSWPGTGVASVRPDGYLGFSAGSVNSSEVAAWLSRVAVG
jgi:2-polyprenyl-6-methoxyphenol hydroxylase-like FAD-dependent oxidoreductase